MCIRDSSDTITGLLVKLIIRCFFFHLGNLTIPISLQPQTLPWRQPADSAVVNHSMTCLLYTSYDTFGPFKLVGGIAKGHPDDKDIQNAVEFVKDL